jgi:predicted DNA-binding transcriptional regulator AlpA
MQVPQQTYLQSSAVRTRYGVSDMTIWRWLHRGDLGFPVPIRINNRRFWRLTDLEAWEASRPAVEPSHVAVQKSTPPDRSRHSGSHEHHRQTGRAA